MRHELEDHIRDATYRNDITQRDKEIARLRAAVEQRDADVARAYETGKRDGETTLIIENKNLWADNARLRAKVERLRATVRFFASVIKSGESWSSACYQQHRAVLADDGFGGCSQPAAPGDTGGDW